MSRTSTLPVGVASVGGLLPEETLRRLSTGNSLSGTAPAAYHLGKDETVVDAAERAWTYLRGRYASFKDQLAKLPEDDPAIGVTREYWLGRLFQELGFGRLPHTPAGGLTSDDGEKQFAISHQWQHVPIHQLGWGVALDKRTKGVPGAADSAPQSLVQEYLNRSDAALWGIVTNGRLLRVLRDSSALAGSAYVEFDLEAIFEGEAFDAFLLLYRVAHVSRFETQGEDAGPASCWLEKWRQEAIDSGVRVLEELRKTVKTAIETLGTGFIQHPDNEELRKALEDRQYDEVTPETLHRALLRTVYRLLFLFVAEDREVLLDPAASQEAHDRYATYFSTERLRRLAARRHGGRHSDEWQALTLILDGLGQECGRPELGLPALGGIFELTGADTALHGCSLANEHLFTAVRSLSRVRDEKARRIRRVDFKHLGAEELGSVYEWLLSYVPKYDPAERTFSLRELGGNERKTSGSYYTPSSLIDVLLDSALEPVIDDAVKSGRTVEEQERALLALTICDPACGSGHFLVAAARRIAKRLAFVRTGDPEPSNEEVRRALREVVTRCIYGVDINPMAIELAKVSLWLEALEPGKPLGFLDAHLKVGNALLGTTPALLLKGIPDAAYKPLIGDDKKIVNQLRKENTTERSGQIELEVSLFDGPVVPVDTTDLASQVGELDRMSSASLADIHKQACRYTALQESPDLAVRKRVADAWCAAFVWPRFPAAPRSVTTATLQIFGGDEEAAKLYPRAIPTEDTEAKVRELAERYAFFHWYLEFPTIFRVGDDAADDANPYTGWQGGFSCVLGNPPWERVKLQEQEFFAARDEKIAKARNAAARKRLIEALAGSEEPTDRALYADFHSELRKAAGMSHLLRSSGRYPLTGQGDVNTYSVFAETGRTVTGPNGRSGLVLPTGIATDATTAPFFSDLVRCSSLASLLEFENEEFLLSRAVHHSVRFCLLTVGGREVKVPEADFAFGSRKISDIEARRFVMPPEDILLLNPNTGTAPLFRSRRDAQITLGIYRRVPVLWRDIPSSNPWNLSFMRMFDMANDSGLFHTREELESAGWTFRGNCFIRYGETMLPLYEAKMVYHFDHRLGTYEGQTRAQANMGTLPRLTLTQKRDPYFRILSRYWVAEAEVRERLKDSWPHGWLLGWRDVARSTDERSMICDVIPRVAVGHKFPLLFATYGGWRLAANLSSLAFDYVARQKLAGTSMSYFILKQLPALPPKIYEEWAIWGKSETLGDWIDARVLELTYTAWDMRPFARDLSDDYPPFIWDEERRLHIRSELEAAYFHLYQVGRDDVGFIMDTFGAFRRNDPERFQRTKALILNTYDAIAQAIRTGEPYRSILDPHPGHGPRHPTPVDV
ncbi:N-6 DNA methylase [Actinoallomurus sp. NPDC052274]|uniref:Eco57I restriction-modification methylase domain-containing protein n=1 Tax=Actinoallomurus sp. NPDC052274 TaxID=3155420 RepID=UPI00342E351E